MVLDTFKKLVGKKEEPVKLPVEESPPKPRKEEDYSMPSLEDIAPVPDDRYASLERREPVRESTRNGPTRGIGEFGRELPSRRFERRAPLPARRDPFLDLREERIHFPGERKEEEVDLGRAVELILMRLDEIDAKIEEIQRRLG